MQNGWCGSCGRNIGSEPIRCPRCGRVVCEKCSIEYHEKATGVDKMLCRDCDVKRRSEDQLEEEKRRKSQIILYGKIFVIFAAILIILGIVIRW